MAQSTDEPAVSPPELSEHEVHVIVGALEIAAGRYQETARECRKGVHLRAWEADLQKLASTFDQKATEARELAGRLVAADGVVVVPPGNTVRCARCRKDVAATKAVRYATDQWRCLDCYGPGAVDVDHRGERYEPTSSAGEPVFVRQMRESLAVQDAPQHYRDDVCGPRKLDATA